MFGLFRPKSRITASEAARILSAARGQNDRERKRAMANQMRADMRANGRANLPDIDWSAL